MVVVLFWQYQPQNWPSSLRGLELLRELPCATSNKYTDLTCSVAKGPQVHRSDLLFVLGQRTRSTQIWLALCSWPKDQQYTDLIAVCLWQKNQKYTDLTCSLSFAKWLEVHRSVLLFVLGQRTRSSVLISSSVQFSSRWYICTKPVSQKFPLCHLWNSFSVHLIDSGQLSSF